VSSLYILSDGHGVQLVEFSFVPYWATFVGKSTNIYNTHFRLFLVRAFVLITRTLSHQKENSTSLTRLIAGNS
jgi:hypothetical protein